ncbi:hypothetical protein OAP51_07510 [Alphaproteobacteria bacterium]|nr:hypothetical protein [Alphaproteobacteria bacterium]
MSFDERRSQLVEAFWVALLGRSFAELSLEILAGEAGRDGQEHLASPANMAGLADITDLACVAVAMVDNQALAEIADDFNDAGDASVQEKLVEGLIHRFESFAPLKPQMQALHLACMRNPVLGMALGHQLLRSIDRLLQLCGDDSSGMKRILRVKGVCAVVMRVRSTWMADETADLSQTLKQIDSELEKAREWAVSLKILEQDEGQS